jgi:hypothetical protein
VNKSALFGRIDHKACEESRIVWVYRHQCLGTKIIYMGASPVMHMNKSALFGRIAHGASEQIGFDIKENLLF